MWVILTTLCIILVIIAYYKYKTHEGFATSGVDWFGNPVQNAPSPGETIEGSTYFTADTTQDSNTLEEVYPVYLGTPIPSTSIAPILSTYSAVLATVDQLRKAVGAGFHLCAYGYLQKSSSDASIVVGMGGKFQELSWCGGKGLSANSAFDNGVVITRVPTETNTASVVYVYGIKPPQNEPHRSVTLPANQVVDTYVGLWNETVANWWNRASPPSKHELYLVYPITDGDTITIDATYTEPTKIATAFKSTVATIGQAHEASIKGIMQNAIYPHWTVMGALSRDELFTTARIVSETETTEPSSSSALPQPSVNMPPAKLELQMSATASAATTQTVPGLLLYGPKPSYDKRDVIVGGRKYRAEFYNTVRNVWSKYEIAQYKCKDISKAIRTKVLPYGVFADQYVAEMEKQVNIKITATDNNNRAYPGCNPECNACEKTLEPYYPLRQLPDKSKYDTWKHQPVDLEDDPRVLNEQMLIGQRPDPAKLSSAIRLINACKAAGGLPALTTQDSINFNGCPTESWCCSPNTDIPILLPLSERDPASKTVGKTCEPAEEECDLAPRPAPVDAEAYLLSKDGQRSRITNAVKKQFCKSKSTSIRTFAQQQKSRKLLGRIGSQ